MTNDLTYPLPDADLAELLFDSHEIDMKDTIVIRVMIRMASDAMIGADQTACDLIQEIRELEQDRAGDYEIETQRRALLRAKQRSKDYGVLYHKLKQMQGESDDRRDS